MNTPPISVPLIGEGGKANRNWWNYLQGLNVIQSGFVMNFAGTSIPSGWLQCNGLAVSRAQYASLFSAIGTSWGAGNGSTTFNLPTITNTPTKLLAIIKT